MQSKNIPSRVLDITSGLMSGFVAAFIILSFCALIFNGKNYLYFSVGVSCTFFSFFIVNILSAYFGGFAYGVSRPEPTVAAVLVGMFISLNSSSLMISDQTVLPTLLAGIMILSLMVGIMMFLLGHFRIGHWIRSLPYPVLGGIVVGSSFILFRFSLGILINNHPYLNPLELYTHVFFALIIAALLFYKRNSWFFLVVICLSCISILSYILLKHLSTGEAQFHGWLFTTYQPSLIYNMIDTSSIHFVNWNLLFIQWPYFLIGSILTIIIFLSNVSGLELADNKFIDVNKELKISGIGNVLGGLLFSFPSNISLNGSLLNKALGATSVISAISACLFCVVIFFIFPSVILIMPIPVVCGILFFLAFRQIHDWLYLGFYRLTSSDYFIIFSIGLIIFLYDFIVGVAVGILFALILFIYNYTKINPIKISATRVDYFSNVRRAIEEEDYLIKNGSKIRIFRLQGYLFFGLTRTIIHKIQSLISSHENTIQYIIFDFKYVTGFDITTLYNWIRLKQLASSNNIQLVFSQYNYSEAKGFIDYYSAIHKHSFLFFPDIDHALEWCEDQVLINIPNELKKIPTIEEILHRHITDKEMISTVISSLEKNYITAGEPIFVQGDNSDCLYFIEKGTVSISVQEDGNLLRLFKGSQGTIFGEMGLYLNQSRFASVYADTDGIIYKLSRTNLEKIERQHPEAAIVFHKMIITLLSNRTLRSNELLQLFLK